MTKKHYAAVDLGGTKTYAVLADEAGRTVARSRLDTMADKGADAVVGQIVTAVRNALRQAGPDAFLHSAGLCAAGFFDWEKRVLISSPNIPGLIDVPLEQELASLLGVPVMVENDANAAALGEGRYGAARGHSDLIYMTVSTGIGTGLILENRIYRGSRGFAGEAGHMIVKPDGPACGCGRRGCLEALASGTAIARAANEAIGAGIRTSLSETAKGGTVTAADVFAAARSGDRLSREILEESIHYLGIGLVNLVNLLNPGIIVIGGGVAEAGDDLFTPLRQFISEHAIPPSARQLQLKKAEMGVEAGVAGMLCLLQAE